jgi:putative transposase
VGKIKVRWHRPLPEEAMIKQVWITRKADGWYATFSLSLPEPIFFANGGPAIGIDVGIFNLFAFSDGTLISNPRWYQESERRLAHLDKILSHKKKGSKRWKRMCRKIAKMYLKRGKWKGEIHPPPSIFHYPKVISQNKCTMLPGVYSFNFLATRL